MDDDDGGISQIQKMLGEMVSRELRERRPSLEDVIRVLGDSFARLTAAGEVDIVPDLQGPDVWSWTDRAMVHLGFEKVFVLTRSVKPESLGYPMLTIRQMIAPHFDSQFSLSSLIIGPDDNSIAHSVSILITNHSGAFQGIRESVVAFAGGGAPAAFEKIREMKRRGDGEELDLLTPRDPKEVN